MKISPILQKQHIGWHFKKFWAQFGARKIEQTGIEKILTEKGVSVVQPKDILSEKRVFDKIEIVGYKEKPQERDSSHPNWHDRTLLTYKDNNVLLQGLEQAKLLTNTVEIQAGLPDSFELDNTKRIDERVKEIIKTAHIYDAEQKKLPKIMDPNRPAWNFPRVYGITQDRVNKLLLTNLLQLVENSSPPSVVKQRYFFNDAFFIYNFERSNDLIQFELKADTLVTSSKPIAPIVEKQTENPSLPNIDPIKPTITLNEENIYKPQTVYPVNLKLQKSHPHTIFVYHNEEEVKNLFEEPVTTLQIYGRSLLKTFAAAASYATALYGPNVENLPKPVTVQCVHSNGRLFNFGILQLNTLNLEQDADIRNIWFQSGQVPLFDSCCYKMGRPSLEGYNNKVVQYIKTFYNNN